jgi:hypothetical protein
MPPWRRRPAGSASRAKNEPTSGRGKQQSSLRIHCAAPSLTLVGESDHYEPSKRHDCASNKQRQASLAKCVRHRDIGTVRPSGQSLDEFADTLSVLFHARSNDANSDPRKQQPGWRLARLPLYGLAHRSSDCGVRPVGVAQGSARESTA